VFLAEFNQCERTAVRFYTMLKYKSAETKTMRRRLEYERLVKSVCAPNNPCIRAHRHYRNPKAHGNKGRALCTE